MFFALRGQKTNGEKYIEEAVQKGASVIVCSKNVIIKIITQQYTNPQI